MTQIAFIGLGHMGLPMARNLLNAGHTLSVFDLVASAVNELAAQGARAASSAAGMPAGWYERAKMSASAGRSDASPSSSR